MQEREPGLVRDEEAIRDSPKRPWLGPHRPGLRRFAQPILDFVAIEASGGAVLLTATVIALLWANSPWARAYETFWATPVSLSISGLFVENDLRGWVNEAAMVIFFFVVGLELKTELVKGELAERSSAILPVAAAIGGVMVPAAIFLAVNAGGGELQGWGVVIATDIAFSLGVLALLGDRISPQLRSFLLALAVVDDMIAVSVIALFYGEPIHLGWLLATVGLLGGVILLRVIHVWYIPVYALLGIGIWFTIFQSGIHPTIAGVVLGLLAPATALLGHDQAHRLAEELKEKESGVEEAENLSFVMREAAPVTDRIQAQLHPWSSYVIIPLFALANAGVSLSSDLVMRALRSPVAIGIVLGLVIGKPVGILLGVWLGTRAGDVALPEGTGWRHFTGLGLLAGIGFTMSLFISSLAFTGSGEVGDTSKVSILLASTLAGILGWALLSRATGDQDGEAEDDSTESEDQQPSERG